MGSLILIILVIIPGVRSADWGVTFKSQCALKGTSVVIKCTYDYPVGHFVTSVSWSKAQRESDRWSLVPLSNLPSPPNHFRYVGNYWRDCSLQVNDVQHSDDGFYFFKFVTTLNRWTSKSYAHLSVRELTAVGQPSTVTEGGNVSLTCVSGCLTPVDVVWFRDGQRVLNPVFQARKEDAGRYYCAVLGQETIRSAAVALNVQYAPENVTLSVTPSGDVVKGDSVTLTCSSDARPPVAQSGYRLYKDGHFIGLGQNHTIADIQHSQGGLYSCQAWNNISWRGIDFINSTEVHLDVRYHPVNISISMNPLRVLEGSSVTLSCSSDSNPAADNYTWYKRTASPNSTLQVGSGQVLSIPSVDASHTGLYLCRARNALGENNSTEVLLATTEEEHGGQPLAVIAGISVALLVTLVFALLLLWRKHRTHAEKQVTTSNTVSDFGLSGRGSSSSATEEQSDNVYVNIHTLPSCPPPATDTTPLSQRISHHEHDAPASNEDEVTYSTVSIKPRNPRLPHSINNSRARQDSWSKTGVNDDSVIYTTVAKSS
ncbi:B-cell receptor CD22-like isoform X2 [Chelmon rostratus]|uniref:B-cell receptor CD22-like isoform X2 n=1 Tax=Chelmon rostratus TaxID=109905 RepID=UPI001BE4EB26|nr:B-cell receptor CD22-like isoform X2 [Chelmon rostratus]